MVTGGILPNPAIRLDVINGNSTNLNIRKKISPGNKKYRFVKGLMFNEPLKTIPIMTPINMANIE